MIHKIVNKFLRGKRSLARDGEIIGLDAGLTTLEQAEADLCAAGGFGGPTTDGTEKGQETPDSSWDEALHQRRKEMKQFMRIGAIAASDERAELLRALKHARRAIDACAPFAETVEAMTAPEFRGEINRLMVCFAEVVARRPDSHESVWDVIGGSQPYLRANSSEDHEGA